VLLGLAPSVRLDVGEAASVVVKEAVSLEVTVGGGRGGEGR